jgi:hypothetical protein
MRGPYICTVQWEKLESTYKRQYYDGILFAAFRITTSPTPQHSLLHSVEHE